MIRNISFTVAAIACAMYSLCIVTTKSANILIVLPIPTYNHQIIYRTLWTSLSQRGHKVVVITTNSINETALTNITMINLQLDYTIIQNQDFVRSLGNQTWLHALHDHMWLLSQKLVMTIYEHPQVRKIYAPDSDERFDAVIVELLMTPALYPLAHRFNASLIGMLSLGISSHQHYMLGAPVLPSHPSSWEMETVSLDPSFWQRTKNFIRQWYHIYCVFNHFLPAQQALAERYLGRDIPRLSDMLKNISMIFQNQEKVISHVRPNMPSVISFSGLHLLKKPAPLSKELERFLTDTPNGFIYLSLGTVIKTSMFPKHILDIFYDVLTNLPCKVLWKTDIELPKKADNIYTADWFLQQSVLAHPKIRLFVYQGGIQSTEEAVHYAVPLLGIPIICEQFAQINKMISLGVARKLRLSNMSKETLNASIRDMLNDKRYKENMLNVKALVDDKPYDSLSNLIWWIEFVIRHKGAPHFRSSITNYSWYQRNDMDVIALISIIIFVTSVCLLIIIYKVIRITFNYYTQMSVRRKEKIN